LRSSKICSRRGGRKFEDLKISFASRLRRDKFSNYVND